MKKFSASVCALAAVALLGSSLSFADGRDHGGGDEYRQGRQHGRQWEDQGHGRGDGRRDGPRHEQRYEQHFDQRDGRWNERRPDYNARGPGFYRGGYIAREYRGPAYVVDYRDYHLSRPPYGHRWVQVGADYVLIAIATGLIANIILNN